MIDNPEPPGSASNEPASTQSDSGTTRTVVANRLDFSASLESFQGPLDLLLFLIKENEIDITDIPISRILEQYLRFLDQAEQWDLQLAGEFLVMAATLMEIKSRELLPVQPELAEGEEAIEDPRSELVRQLLQYRRLKEQARALDDLQNQWRQCRPRGLFGDVPEKLDENVEMDRATAREALLEVDLYALFAAYERILKSVLAQTPKNIVYDGESIEQKITRIEGLLKTRPYMRFAEMIIDPSNRADIAATFVALLELVRRRAVRLVQATDFGDLDVKVPQQDEMDEATRTEAAHAEATAEAAIQAKLTADAQAQAQTEGGENLPWLKRRRQARPKFEGVLRPEDLEEIDAEENEIGRRIDAILAAADVICERFELSRDGKQREDNAPLEGAAGETDALVSTANGSAGQASSGTPVVDSNSPIPESAAGRAGSGTTATESTPGESNAG